MLVCSIGAGFALPPTIGVASAIGTFLVNTRQVEGNSNLFDGSEVKTGKASSQIYLQNGTALTLGINSAGKVYGDRLVLDEGATEIGNMHHYSVRAANYRIEAAEAASKGVVRLESDVVEIAALSGSLNVFDAGGALLTHIGAGTASAFQTGASPGKNERGAAVPDVNTHRRVVVATSLLLAGALAGLGLAVVAITQPSPTSH
jgi:hypothetical protein